MAKAGIHVAVIAVVTLVIIAIWRRLVPCREKSGMENGSCAQECPHGAPKNAAGCALAYGSCINQCGPDLTSKYAPPCVTKCAWEAAACRQKFLNCANECGQLWVT